MLGLRCYEGFSLIASSGGYPLVVPGLLTAAASLLSEHGARVCGLSCGLRALEHRVHSCGARASLLHGTYHLPGPGIEPISLVLAGRFFTTGASPVAQMVKNLFAMQGTLVQSLGQEDPLQKG